MRKELPFSAPLPKFCLLQEAALDANVFRLHEDCSSLNQSIFAETCWKRCSDKRYFSVLFLWLFCNHAYFVQMSLFESLSSKSPKVSFSVESTSIWTFLRASDKALLQLLYASTPFS